MFLQIHLHTMVAYLMFGSCGIAAGLLILLLPETLGRTPPNSFEELQNQFAENHTEIIALKSSNHNKYQKVSLLFVCEINYTCNLQMSQLRRTKFSLKIFVFLVLFFLLQFIQPPMICDDLSSGHVA